MLIKINNIIYTSYNKEDFRKLLVLIKIKIINLLKLSCFAQNIVFISEEKLLDINIVDFTKVFI